MIISAAFEFRFDNAKTRIEKLNQSRFYFHGGEDVRYKLECRICK